jgi:arylsulfatase B
MLVATLLTATSSTTELGRPHIVFILGDDTGWNNIGVNGNEEVRTPTIDGLFHTGLRMDRMYSYKYCSPSRSSFLSGRLPLHVTQNNQNNLLTNRGGPDLRMTLLPEQMRRLSYSTSE